jgi:prepilin-type processing-associated H-X9-DG protein
MFGGNQDGDVRCHSLSSLHPGGAQTALCDGSVRFVPETTDTLVRYAVATREGGEPLTLP